jgi:hypothetical protein
MDEATNHTADEFPISQEIAEQQIDSLFEYYDIDIEMLNEDEANAIQGAKLKLIKMVRRGFVTVLTEGDSCIVKHTALTGQEYTYKELTGLAKTSMGKHKREDMHGRIYALMGALAGLPFNTIAKMKGRDMTIVECLGLVFLLA